MKRVVLVAIGAVLTGSCAVNDAFPAPTQVETPPAAAAPAPYLDEQTLLTLARAVSGPPAAGSTEAAMDQMESQQWRTLEDSDRWRLAQTHAEVRPALGMQHFDCPLNTRLAEEPPPALLRLLGRSLRDASVASNAGQGRGFPTPADRR